MGTAAIKVDLFGGARTAMPQDSEVLITIHDNKARNRFSQFVRGSSIRITGLEVFDDGGDDCAVITSVKGCSDGAFFPVSLVESQESPVSLMLPPRNPAFNLSGATWENLRAAHQPVFNFLAGGQPDVNVDLYKSMLQDHQPEVACLLNITTAMACLPVQPEGGVLSCFKKILIQKLSADSSATEGMRQDRFFAWGDPRIIPYLRQNTEGAQAIFDVANADLHPGADLSFKEIRFGEANLQFTFHQAEKDETGNGWVKVEMDMDYYKDEGAHFFLEVIPNEVVTRVSNLLHLDKPHFSDPVTIYSLRWMAGQRVAHEPEFAPPFTLQAA